MESLNQQSIDGTAHARIEAYNKQLVLVEKQGKE